MASEDAENPLKIHALSVHPHEFFRISAVLGTRGGKRW